MDKPRRFPAGGPIIPGGFGPRIYAGSYDLARIAGYKIFLRWPQEACPGVCCIGILVASESPSGLSSSPFLLHRHAEVIINHEALCLRAAVEGPARDQPAVVIKKTKLPKRISMWLGGHL